MSEYNRIIRKFERLVFNGVPEKPEPNYERELNADVNDRFTGKSQILSQSLVPNKENLRKIADIYFYPDSETIKVVE